MDVSPEAKLNKQSKFNYKSLEKPLQLDLSQLPKEIHLKQLVSDGPDLDDQFDLKGENDDGQSRDVQIFVYVALITFSLGVTIALILQIQLGETLVFTKGALVSDDDRCTALGLRILHDGGSSVDAAIAATLCLGVVHPHVSGVGGGGVMLVHDVRKNETKVIDFQGVTLRAVTQEMLQSGFETKAGLQVGVPGMLRGLQQAQRLHGSLSWQDVVAGAAAVAKDGFNISLSLADAISEVKGEQLPQRFRATFFPRGRALQAGSVLKMPGLAEIIEADPLSFYSGNFSQEMEDEVRANGGVLGREDISSYSAETGRPMEGLYEELIVKVPSSPSTDVVLLLALKLLNGVSENNNTENHTDHWTVEALKAALARGPDDPKHNFSVTDELPDLLSHYRLSPPEERSTSPSLQAGLVAAQVVVMGPDDLIVTVASSLGRLFGSRLMTSSGIILNSFNLEPSCQNEVKCYQRNDTKLGSRPLSALMPTIVVPAWKKCGIYMALSDSGRHSLSTFMQVLMSAHSYIKGKNDSSSLGRFHLELQSDFPRESAHFLHTQGDTVQQAKMGKVVRGIVRIKDTIKGIAVPELLS